MIHNTHMSQFIPPSAIQKTAGTWTPTIGSNVASDVRGAADAAFTLLIPIAAPQNANYHNGARLKSIDVYYKIATGACDGFATVELEKITLPANAAAPTGAALTTTLDTGHDTAAERLAIADHTMTVTVTTPEWMDDSYAYVLQCVVDAAANTVFTLYGARANFDLRID